MIGIEENPHPGACGREVRQSLPSGEQAQGAYCVSATEAVVLHKMAGRLWKTTIAGIDTSSQLFETWIPDGGFEVQRRKTPDGMADCLVPKSG